MNVVSTPAPDHSYRQIALASRPILSGGATAKVRKDLLNTPLAGRTAVIVTMEAIQALHLRKVLGRAGVEVLDTVTKEQEIVGSVTSRRPDFVLLDVGVVKSVGGSSMRRALAALGVCTILLSHLPDSQSNALVSEWGAQGYLAKPVGHEQILAQLREACTD